MKNYPQSFPTLRKTITEQWEKIKHKHPGVTNQGFSDWVLKGSGMVPDSVDELNWRTMWSTRLRIEELSRFQWIGADYAIVRAVMQHDKCSKRWYQYYGMRVGKGENEDYSDWLGYKYGIRVPKTKKNSK